MIPLMFMLIIANDFFSPFSLGEGFGIRRFNLCIKKNIHKSVDVFIVIDMKEDGNPRPVNALSLDYDQQPSVYES
jgi:hypothetical protein